MTAAVPFPLPPGRVLSAWRRELSAFRPSRLRLAHLLLHRVEALIRRTTARTVDPLHLALLKQLSAAAPQERLGVDRAVLSRWLRELADAGLAEASEGRWRPTVMGSRALDTGACTEAVEERRVFTFLDDSDPLGPPSFVPLQGRGVALAPPPGWRFDPAALEACVRRPAEWKARCGFPADVDAVVAPHGPGAQSAPDWRRVVLDRAEQIVLVFVPSADAPPRHLGFAARPEGWALLTAAPALILQAEEGRAEALPELADEPALEAWREAWRGWCMGRRLQVADACRVEAMEDRIRVTAPRALAERMGAERSEAWLLAGDGRVRVAAPMEIVAEE
jgi:hypothetical protein